MKKIFTLITCLLAWWSSFAQNSPERPAAKSDSASTKEKVQQLKTVNIQAKKPLIEHRADKIVVNVENNILSAGATALDLLEKAPGVIVDRHNDQIRLNAKSGLTVMIDGKPTILSGADLINYLGNIGSDQIGTFEIISNPSAKYDASGSAGIINIKMKKNRNFGTNASLSTNVSRAVIENFPSNLYRNGINLNVNHSVAKWNLYGNAMFAHKVNYNQITALRSTLANGLKSDFDQQFGRTNTGDGYSGRFGVDYKSSSRTTLGLILDANTLDASMNFLSATTINEQRGTTLNKNSLQQSSLSKSPATNLTANFNLRHDFNAEGTNLSVDVDYSGFSNKKNEDFDTKYLNSTGNIDQHVLLRNRTNAQIDVYAVKADFAHAINKLSSMEAGFKSSYVTTNNDFVAEQYQAAVWQNDSGKSNQFLYKENINALYANYTTKWKKFDFQLGLRAEHTFSDGFSVTDQKSVARNYFSLFPTLFVSQRLTESHQLRYSYGRRVDRPNYQQLNPFIFYLDAFTLEYGNPYLKPMFTDNFELGYAYKNAFSVSLNYADTRDLIVQITSQNDSTRTISLNRSNIGRSENYALGLDFPFQIAKWWTSQNSIGGNFMKVSDGNLLGGIYNRDNWGYNINTAHSFQLPNQFSLEANFWLNSANLNGQEQATRSRYALNLGAQKSFLAKKLRMRLTVEDLFLTNQFAGKIVYQNLDLNVRNRSASRRVGLNVSYNFGNQQIKGLRQRKTATEDLKGRATSN